MLNEDFLNFIRHEHRPFSWSWIAYNHLFDNVFFQSQSDQTETPEIFFL